MKRIALSIILILSGCIYAHAQIYSTTNNLINEWEARQKAAKQRYGNGIGNRGIQYSQDNSEMINFKANFNIGEDFKNDGQYSLACQFYLKALKIIQNTNDATLRQLGESSYNECIINNITYCMNMFSNLNPGQYLEVDETGHFWVKGAPVTSSDYSGGSQPSSQTLSAEDYARVQSALEEIDATIHTTHQTPQNPAPPKQQRTCGGCKGSGVCYACNGTGKERIIYSSAYTTCKTCHGTGKCPHCSGTGHYTN